jgi:hypothetical protein
VSRRKSSVKRPVLPDARYDSQTVSKFINNMMLQGRKSTAERIFYGAMDLVEARTAQPGVNVFKQALANLKPVVEVKSRRVGGATYQVPVEAHAGALWRPRAECKGFKAVSPRIQGRRSRDRRPQEFKTGSWRPAAACAGRRWCW